MPHALNKSEANIKLQGIEERSRSRAKDGHSFEAYNGLDNMSSGSGGIKNNLGILNNRGNYLMNRTFFAN